MVRAVSRSVRVPAELDRALKLVAGAAGVDKSDLYRAGAALVLAIIKYGKAPGDVLALARVYDPEAPSVIARLLEARPRVEPILGVLSS